MAIDKNVFATELKSLSDWFNRPISDEAKARLYLILSSELSTDEFKQAVIWAWKHCNSFPSPIQMIDGVKGSIRDRAIVEWSSFSRSEIGCMAFASCDSEDLAFKRKEFIENFIAFAKNAAPEKLQITPVTAIAATKKKAYALPHPNDQTPEQRTWSMEQWETHLSQQEAVNEITSYAS